MALVGDFVDNKVVPFGRNFVDKYLGLGQKNRVTISRSFLHSIREEEKQKENSFFPIT